MIVLRTARQARSGCFDLNPKANAKGSRSIILQSCRSWISLNAEIYAAASDFLLSPLELSVEVALLSLLLSLSLLLEPLSLLLEFVGAGLLEVVVFLLSLIYQPEPLKMIPAGEKTFLTALPHSGQVFTGSSLKL